MRKFTFYFKSLLLAAGLLMGSTSAWADTQTIEVLSENYESYSVGDITSTMQSNGWLFQSKNGKNVITIVQGSSPNATKYFDFYYPDGGASRNQSWTMGVDGSLTEDNWTLTFSAALNPGANNSSNVFSIVGTSSGNVTSANNEVTNPFLKLKATAAGSTTYKPTFGATDYDESFTLTSGVWYNFTIKATSVDYENNTANIYVKITSYDNASIVYEKTVNNLNTSAIGKLRGFCWNSPRGASRLSLDDVLLTKEVDAGTCAEPTSTITGAAGTSRKFTLACETPASTIYYSETEKEYGDDGWIEYTSEVITAATTIYMYAATSSAHSTVTNFATGAGTVIDLANPTMQVSAITPNGSYYTPTFSFANGDNSSLIGSPSATLSATFNGNAILGFDGTFTPNMDGILVVTSSAEGYGSSEITVNCFVLYDLDWQSVDYSTLTEEDLATSFPTWEKTESGRWSSWKDIGGNYTYYTVTDGNSGYAEFTFDTNLRIRRNVVSLVPTYGIGRNTNETLKVLNTSDNDIVSLKIYRGYGNYSVADAHWFSYNFRNGSDVTFTLNNGALLVQASIYTPVASVPVTVTAASYATYVPSHDLDFSTTEIKAYKVKITGKETATLTRVDKVSAGAPVLLYKEGGATENIPVTTGAAAIPSSENNLVAGTGDAVPSQDGIGNVNMILNNGASGIGFYFANDQIVAANRAYLQFAFTYAPDIPAGAKSLKMIFADEATEVVAPAAADVEEEEVLYNMAGVQVDKNFKGFVINQKGVKRFNK